MKTGIPQSRSTCKLGFTLIEMIGVLAIMAIIAATITPNALRAIDRATVRTEATTLHSVGEQVKIFLKTNGWPPGLNPNLASRLTWDQDLWKFADLSPTDLLTNKRQMNRAYIYEPGASPQRVLILSSMRTGLALPTAANLNTLPLFDNVWNTVDGSLPSAGQSWAGWAAWRNTLNATAGDYLVIERVNLAPIYNTDLQNLTITLNNQSPTSTSTISYDLVSDTGVIRKTGAFTVGTNTIFLNSTTVNPPPRPRDRLDLYHKLPAGLRTLDYSYVLTTTSSGKTFTFKDSTLWVPEP